MSEQLPATPRGRLATVAAKLAAAVDRNDVFGLVGAGLLAAGLWQVYPPAAPIVLGILCLALAVFGARNADKP